ncbi:MAG: hypothetical protein J5I90_02785 [Caldilineales bacterium]|nr:hypothetical protein [Caldilineales bacterium]
MFDTLTYIDLTSLALLALLLVLALAPRLQRPRKPRTSTGPALVGGVTLDPDAEVANAQLVDTNDALHTASGVDNHYLGPDQTTLALALLDPPETYASIGGFIPADLVLFLIDEPLPDRFGSTDPAAAPALFLLDPEPRLLERGLEQPDPPYLYPLVGTVIALIALIPLIFRLLP